jgi:hypothetical protein
VALVVYNSPAGLSLRAAAPSSTLEYYRCVVPPGN